MWLRTPEIDYSIANANWSDRSGNGNALNSFGSFAVPSTVVAGQTAAIFSNAFSVVTFMSGDLMNTPALNSDAGLSELTIITVYKTLNYNGLWRPLGFGAYRNGDVTDNFDLATDPTIRKDNGFIGGYAGASDLTPAGYFIRSARMSSSDGVDEWFFVDSINGVEPVLNTASSFATQTDFSILAICAAMPVRTRKSAPLSATSF